MKLPDFAVRRFITVLMIFLGIMILGIVALVSLPIDLFPEIEIPAISVVTIYEGVSAADVESQITKKIEDRISTVSNLDELTSTSQEGISVVTALFDWKTNLDEASNDIRDALELAKPGLPEDANDPMMFKINTSMFPILVYAATADENYGGLNYLIENEVADPLRRIPGVGAVQTIGGLERQIRVEFDPRKIEAYNLNLQGVMSTIARENADQPVGSVKINQTEYIVRVPGEFDSPDEISNVVLGVYAGRPVYLRDVARVDDSFKEITAMVRSEGRQGVIFMVQKQSGANSVQIADKVRAEVMALSKNLPSDVHLTEVYDTSIFIRRSLSNLSESVILGALVVLLVVYLFLRHIRSSFIVALTIPFSLIIAFFAFLLLKYTLNMVSLMSFAIAVGLVVDDAIVVLDNITRHIESGSRPLEAALYGTSEVGLAVMASTLTVVAVFAPMLFAGGLTGIMFTQLAAAVIIMILASLFASLTLTPALASRILRRSDLEMKTEHSAVIRRIYNTSERWFHATEEKYGVLLAWALRNKKKTVLTTAAVFLGSLALLPFVSTEFIPEGDSGDVQINFEMAPGTRMETTSAVATELAKVFTDSVPEVKHVFYRAGQSSTGMSAAMGQAGGSHVGMVGAKLVEQKFRDRSSAEVADIIRRYAQTVPGILKMDIKAGNPMGNILFGGDKPITIQIIGHDVDQTNELAAKIKRIVENTRGAKDAKISRPVGRPELIINIDREKAALLGTGLGDISDAIKTQVLGSEATKYREAGDEYQIYIRAKEDARQNIEDLSRLVITSRSGATVRLDNVATIVESTGPTEIARRDRERIVKVEAEVFKRPLGDVAADIAEELTRIEIPEGIDVTFGGSVKEQRESFTDLLFLLILSLVLVYMVMASQFESLRDPFIIMFSVPFAFVGVIWALILTGTTLSLISFIGVIILVGIVVKNAIIMIDYTNILRRRGLSVNQAVPLAGKHRLRPVLMTALAMILGMLPLALSRNEGAEIWRPLGITVVGGLLVSTLVTLVLIPVIYSIFEGRKNHIQGETS
ncbi:Acriflavin resistance protein [Candidatus Zixiibacteriota bacterium]|nr:Acriflavin resistance protein [candidate division Zixibacteria bacterium]